MSRRLYRDYVNSYGEPARDDDRGRLYLGAGVATRSLARSRDVDVTHPGRLREGVRGPGDAPQARGDDLAEALRLTQEYVGSEVLPAAPGWSWYDALIQHAPEQLHGRAR